jgi:hypothetical protein
MTESASQALSILRDPSRFEWYLVPIFVVVIYIYNVEVGKRNWNLVFAGLALWGMDGFNEIWNALVFHFTRYAPVWGAPADTAYLILIGLNIEICMMFAILGIATAHALPQDKEMKILGVPNRLVYAVGFSILCVFIECVLNRAGALTWDYPWWNARAPWLIFLAGYLPFFLVAFWVHDMKTVRKKAITVGLIFGFDALCLVLFGSILQWI